MIKINYLGTGWMDGQPDERKLDAFRYLLRNAPLEKVFEKYGNFITSNDKVTRFFGNFYGVSCAFDIFSDESEFIDEIASLIRSNQQRDDYKAQGKINKFEIISVDGNPFRIDTYRANGKRYSHRATENRVRRIECLNLKQSRPYGHHSFRTTTHSRPIERVKEGVFKAAFDIVEGKAQ